MKGKTTRFTTDEVGYPGYWWDVTGNPKTGDVRRFQALRAEGVVSEDDARALAAKIIVAWNFDDDDGQPMPLPKDDPKVWDDLPVAVYARVFELTSVAMIGGRSSEDQGNSKAPSSN